MESKNKKYGALYRKGANKERKIVKKYKEEGWVSFRSAGSHSPIDVFAINPQYRIIKLIQSKSDKMPESEKKRLLSSLAYLEGGYRVDVEVI